ncbi:hypothetical protein HMPREF0621_1487 [Pasteurella dagmatis ATCC 43325]|uniref:Uncharacterized protein n=1 Tax=Pasteurella dagmatis ATCC 43325 TaxID=667128 RepID=C9PR63_9PAST|nr:hypothetical protein HMPREF0621_1487 [Pasteurella dagmatis ATCC 43325]
MIYQFAFLFKRELSKNMICRKTDGVKIHKKTTALCQPKVRSF